MDETIKSGIVGAGFAATFHYESLRQIQCLGVEPVAVYSRRRESREVFASERGLKAADSLEELLEAVDAIHVCVPPALHESVSVAALERDVHVILEKPFTGYFNDTRGDLFSKEVMREEALASAARIVAADRASRATLFYAENWLFAPAIQRECEILRKTEGQILWIIAEESHSGSHSPTYGIWSHSGGGSIMGKGTHPLTAALYLKRVEGEARGEGIIRPKSVTARTHRITQLPNYIDRGFLRTDYTDVEDFGFLHVVFDDGTPADIFASEIVMGGVHNWLEVFANNHRTRCNINPIDGLETYNPQEDQFRDVYVVEKIGTKQGWSRPALDENWMQGYPQEMEVFYRSIREGSPPFSSSELGYDSVSVIYSAYLSAERNGQEVEVIGGQK